MGMGLNLSSGQKIKFSAGMLFTVLFLCMGFQATRLSAQELNARVEILSPQLPQTNKRVLDVLQKIMSDFLNNRSWTGLPVAPNERIDCNFVITISEWDGLSEFSGQAQILSMRPVYQTNYNSPVLNMTDDEFNFSYTEGQMIDYSDQQFTNNLTSLLAYYAYLIIGMDADTFSPEGGTNYFTQAQRVVNNAQNTAYSGWRFMDGNSNRYWLITNLLDRRYESVRKFQYEYSRHGLDLLAENPAQGRKNIVASMDLLSSIDRMAQGAMLGQLLFTAKANEFVGILSGLNPQERVQSYHFLSEIDPSNDSKYQALRGR